jgi:hypothetical protein
MPHTTAARAATIGFRMGKLVGEGYFEPGPTPWADQPAMVAWLKGVGVQFDCLNTSEPVRILNRLERMLERVPAKRPPAPAGASGHYSMVSGKDPRKEISS